jgi:hypothetical protein
MIEVVQLFLVPIKFRLDFALDFPAKLVNLKFQGIDGFSSHLAQLHPDQVDLFDLVFHFVLSTLQPVECLFDLK